MNNRCSIAYRRPIQLVLSSLAFIRLFSLMSYLRQVPTYNRQLSTESVIKENPRPEKNIPILRYGFQGAVKASISLSVKSGAFLHIAMSTVYNHSFISTGKLPTSVCHSSVLSAGLGLILREEAWPSHSEYRLLCSVSC